MPEITRTLLSSLRLAPGSPRKSQNASPRAPVDQDAATRLDTDSPAKSPHAGVFQWLRERVAPRQPEQDGLSVSHALGALKKGGHLPTVASGSASKHVKSLLEGVPAGERASVVAAARFLLPPEVDADVYDAILAHIVALPAAERASLAYSTGLLSPTLALDTMHDAHAYLDLLRTIAALPEQGRTLIRASLAMQPCWMEGIPPQAWNHCLKALASLPMAEVPSVANDVRRLYAGPTPTAGALTAFLECVTHHVALAPAERSLIRDQAKKTRMSQYELTSQRPLSRAEQMRPLVTQSSSTRAEVAQACEDIFAAGPPERQGERAYAAAAMLQATPGDRTFLASLWCDLRGSGISLNRWIVDDSLEPIAAPLRDAGERAAFLQVLNDAFPAGQRRQGSIWLVIRTLARLPAEERADAAGLARALDDRDVLTRHTADSEIVGATPQQRRDHLVRLRLQNATAPAAQQGGAQDLENVMQGALQRQVTQAIEGLRRRFPAPMPTARALQEMSLHLRKLHQAHGGDPDHVLMRVRGGDTEISNALRTLTGARRDGDFSDSVRKTPDMASLCALVWHATSAERLEVAPEQASQDQALMRHGLVMALARCIEDDGHRVCGVGQRQYTIDSLKGFYAEAGDAQQSVTPRSLVTVLTEEFYQSHKDAAPLPNALREFKARAHGVATERFGDNARDMNEFREQFDSYMNMTYEP